MTKTLWRGVSTLLGGIAILSAPGAAQTNGFVLHCLSARAAGQGCVTRARDDVPTDLFRDPAALSWFSRPSLEVNLSSFMPSLTFQNGANQRVVDGALHAYPLGSIAYVGPKAGTRFSWAVGVEPIGGFGSDFSLQNELLGSGTDYESFFAALKAGPAVSLQLLPGVSLGASAYLTYAQIRDFRMPFGMPPQSATGMGMIMGMDPHYPALFSSVTELTAYGDSYDFSGWGNGLSVGLAWKPDEAFRLSASWSPRSTITLDGATATIDMTRQFEAMFGMLVQERMTYHGMTATEAQTFVAQALTGAGMDLAQGTVATYDASTDLSEPQTAGLGIALQLNPRWSLALEGVWMDWSSAEDVMPFRLTAGDNPNVNILVNGDPSNGDFTYPFPLQWKDSWTTKAGVAFAVSNETTLRAGYLRGSNPVPGNTVFIAFPAISTNAVTAGAGFRILGLPLEVALVEALSTRLDGSASGHRVAAEYQASSTTMRQTVFTLGGVWRF